MSRIRIYALAKELGLTPKELILLLNELGEFPKSATGTLDEATANAVRELYKEKYGKPSKIQIPARPLSIFELAEKIQLDVGTIVHHLMTLGQVSPFHEPLPLDLVVRLLNALNIEFTVVQPEPLSPVTVDQERPEQREEPKTEELQPLAAAKDKTDISATETETSAPTPGGEPIPVTQTVKPVPPDFDPNRLVLRPPIVTVMGHVDHGKTTLLDTIRKTNIAAREVGQITQHIGAYEVEWDGRKITFIDTPGHEAFTALRARGAQVTDLVILVVAADDGVMPQTEEAINHAKAADVPIIVAVNKMDKAEADFERVLAQLAERGLIPTQYGGSIACIPISALKGEGIDHLLEEIILQADLLATKADPQATPWGYVLESRMDPRKGPLATVIVEHGTLREGDWIVAGKTYGRVKQMTDWRGQRVQEAKPSQPVSVLGLEDLPEAGDRVEGAPDPKTAREKAEARRVKKEAPPRPEITLETLYAQGEDGKTNELNLIIKADVQGSLDAITHALERLEHPEVTIRFLHKAVGPITETDIDLARASKGVILGFNVRLDPTVRSVLQREPVDVRLYQVIYDLIDDVKKAILGQLKPKIVETVLGQAEVRAVFRLKAGTVAGCFVRKGKIVVGSRCRIIRGGQVLGTSRIASLRHFKQDRTEILEGMECGIGVDGFSDFQEGDVIEAYQISEEQRTLQEIKERTPAVPVPA
ncbi:MAG: translation initiation factor IF-2 [Armatimonadetes bacterium]|nr:translation initiation factor IF-2 [Armatimonadota bacterium]MDW8121962.1 translation initiation factor IF-2 [Armatimonadota bacterium]